MSFYSFPVTIQRAVEKSTVIPYIYRQKLPQVKKQISAHNYLAHLENIRKNAEAKLYKDKNYDLEKLKEAVIKEKRFQRELIEANQIL